MTATRSDTVRRFRLGEAGSRVVKLSLKTWLPRLLGLAFWVAAPLFCLYVIWVGIGQLVNNVNGQIPGIPGSFAAVSHNCQDQLCVTSGTFTSDDGRLVEHNLIGDYRWPLGSISPAVYNTSSGEILGVAPPWDPTSTLTGLVGAFAFVLIWLYVFAMTARDREAKSARLPDIARRGAEPEPVAP